ncbi:hypothetical protein, variant [Cryptococcus amylolentus CBS 6039]|uniref:Uncharacterized protein n=1 Tax=Cryptococcus amylolentus CBS 6039 TaxID=1295533 RepID=A0A1E3HMA5_9TREE|nr:hypothetical protein, variant [Cryptococcus amylolentus CBS 6039]ODN77470.1 hypothetical protein, variant [Cryptococcus amylolentus CBS 6039]
MPSYHITRVALAKTEPDSSMENEHIETIIHKNNVVLSFEFTPARTWLKIVLTSDGHVLLLPSIGQGTTQSRCVAYNNSTALFRFGTPSAFGNENNRQTFFQVEFADTDAILSILAFVGDFLRPSYVHR